MIEQKKKIYLESILVILVGLGICTLNIYICWPDINDVGLNPEFILVEGVVLVSIYIVSILILRPSTWLNNLSIQGAFIYNLEIIISYIIIFFLVKDPNGGSALDNTFRVILDDNEGVIKRILNMGILLGFAGLYKVLALAPALYLIGVIDNHRPNWTKSNGTRNSDILDDDFIN
ncbi:MAG: hypothetical protein GY810_22470 [Aureispira sp.]|nr:hypothetical protein [Aureispira sp.]